jgi:hypothetical protein
MVGDSNNPKPEGLGYGKSENPGLNQTVMGHRPGRKNKASSSGCKPETFITNLLNEQQISLRLSIS